MFRRLAATVAAAALVVVGLAAPATAAGSGDLLPTAATCAAGGGCRPAIEWRTGYYGPTMASGIPRRTLFSVYAVAGEQILLGSSSLPATGAGSSDIVVWNPGVVTDRNATTLPAAQFSCVAQRATTGNGTRGFIATRTEEVAGAESVNGTANAAGYRPCYYTAPSTGIYNVAFYGTAGGSSDVETSTDGVIAPAGAFALYTTSVAAWDVTVRPAPVASTADEAGRLFTYVFAGYTGDNPRPVDMAVYLTTLDGFRYRVDTNGFDPNGFVFYGNQVGFLDADGSPLNHDIVPVAGSANQQVMRSLAGGVQIAPAQYPVSLEPLAAVTLNALGIPTTPSNPTVTAASYAGRITSTGSYQGQGGDFAFTTGTGGTYEIVVSRDGVNYDPGLAVNRSLRGVVSAAGTYTVAWDGLDNADDPFPVGNNFAYTVTLRSGEYHAPMIDVESSVKGGPSITLENPPNGLCPFTGVASNGSNCTRAFYDDRAYLSADGTQVGDAASGQLCSTLVRDSGMPLTTFANYLTGYDSAGTGRAFGTSTKTNVNKACDAVTPSTLGDARGLDLWTYFPSALLTRTLDVLPLPAAPAADDDAYTTPANTTLTVGAGSGVLNGDSGTALTVTAHTTPAQGTVTVAADGALQYVPATGFSGTVTFDYTVTDDAGQSDTGTVTLTVTPTGVADSGAVATGGVLTVPAAAGLLSNDVGTSLTVTASTPPGHGTVTVGADGRYTYTPTVGYSGADTFTYTARDAAGQTYTRSVALTVTPTAADDAATTPVSTPVSPAGGVLANDHGSLTVTAHTAPAHGAVTIDAVTGLYTYTPVAEFSGLDSFTYTVSDGVSAPVTRTVTVTVTPTAADDAATTPANTAVTPAGGVLVNDHGSLTITAHTAPSHGTLTLTAATGAYTYTPADDWSGVDTFTYTVTDGVSAPLTRTVTVTVTPVGADDAASTGVDDPLTSAETTSVLANDLGALTVTSSTAASHGTATVAADGSWTYTPTSGWSGTDTFMYTARDAAGQAVTQTVAVVVVPTAANDSGSTTVGTPLLVPAASGVLANDSGQLTAAVAAGPAHGTVAVVATGAYLYTPAAGFSGSDSFTYTATDGTTWLTRTVTLLVTPTALDDAGTTGVDEQLTVDAAHGALANDAGALTVTSSTQPAHGSATVAGDGSFTYTPPAGWSGVTTLQYTATDGVSTLTRTLTITVLPAAADDSGTTPVDVTLTVPAPGALGNDDGALTVASSTDPAHGAASVDADGAWSYTPDTDWSGTDTFTYTATDGRTDVTATVTVVVTPTAADDAATTAVGTPVVLTGPTRVLANDHGALTLAAVSQPAAGTGSAALGSGGDVTYAPPAGWSGVATFTYTAGDGTSSVTSTVTVTVVPDGADDTGAVAVGGTLTVPAASGVLANDHGGLAVTGHTAPGHGTLTIAADGSYVYQPDAGFSGQDSVTYTATDGDGQQVVRTLTLTVTPTAADDAATTDVGVAVDIAVLGNDLGTLHVTGSGPAAHGGVVVHPDGTLTYTPAAGWSGVDTFTYTASDGTTSVTRTVTVTVLPAVADDAGTTAAGVALAVTDPGAGVLGNDDGALTATLATPPTHGTLILNSDGTYTYTPDDDFSGTDTFTYTAGDGTTSLTGTVTITVTPTGADDAYSTPVGMTRTVPVAAGVLANDAGTLTVTPVSGPSHGTLTLAADGSFSYAPTGTFSGTDTFVYTATDGVNAPLVQTVTITVTPTAFDDSGTTPVDTALVRDAAHGVLTNDVGSVAVIAMTPPGHGALVWAADGSYAYTPVSGFSGTDLYRYIASDGTTNYMRTVRLTVTPTVADDSGTTPVNVALVVPPAGVLANDRGSLDVVAASDPAHGSLLARADGGWTYTPDNDWSGTDTFTYDAADDATTRTATVTVAVTPTGADDATSTPVNTPVTLTGATGVLANDHGALAVTSVTQPPAGTGTVTRAGDELTYSPETGWSGTTAFTYTATDGTSSLTQTVTVVVLPTAADDAWWVAIGGTLTVPAAAGLLADDHGALAVTGVDAPPHGSITWTGDGGFVYTPDPGFSGVDQFDYQAFDGTTTVTATVTITVEPEAADDSATTPVDVTLVQDAAHGVLANDSATLHVTGMADPAHGSVSWAADGSYTFTPDAGWSGTTTFDYTASDGATSVTRTVTVVVTPTAANDSGTTPVDTALVRDAAHGVLANDAGALTATPAADPAHGDVTLAADGSYTYTPDAGWSGVDTFTYTASDGTIDLLRTVTITVMPTAVDDAFSTPVGTHLTVAAATGLLANDHGALLVAEAPVTMPTHGSLSIAGDGALGYDPTPHWSGTDTFTYSASDGTTTLVRQVTIVVTPTVAADTGTTPVDTPLVVAAAGGLLANDDGNLTVAPTPAAGPSHGYVGLAADGAYAYTPDPGWSGTDVLTYTAGDGTAVRSTTLTIVVVPTALADTGSTSVDTPLVVTDPDLGVLGNDAGALHVTATTDPPHGSIAWAADGTFTYTPDTHWSGTDTFTYTATDGTTTLTRTVTITVDPLAADDSGTTPVGTTLTVDAAHGVLANDAGDLHVVSNTQPQDCTASVAADGSYTYVPDPDFSGSDWFTYTATDGTTTVTRTVYLTVTPTADPDNGTTAVDTALVRGVADGLLSGDHGSLTVTGTSDPAHGDAVAATDGSITYTPEPGWSGTDTFTYTADDGVSAPLVRTVTIVVTPIGQDDANTTGVDTTLTVPTVAGVLANDRGTLAVDSWTTPDHGSVAVAGDGGFVYTPPAGWSGTATFDYTAVDGTSSLTQHVTIVVVPTATDDTGAVAVDGVLTVPVGSGLLADDAGTLAVVAVSHPPHGAVSWLPDGSFVYTPDARWSGTDTFTYSASDGTTTLTRTVTIDVTPTAADDAITVPAGQPTSVPASAGVLVNDRGDLSVTGSTQPDQGSVVVATDGGFVYTPPTGWSGVTSFDYSAVDGAGHPVTRTATVTVSPVATDDAYSAGASTTLDVPAAGGLLANDRGALTVTGSTDPGHGTAVVGPDGALRYTPTPGWSGRDTFTYTVSDGVNPPVTRSVTVTVAPPRVAPAAVDDETTTRPAVPVVLHALVNDPAGDHLTWLPGTQVLVDPATGATSRDVVVPGVGRWVVLAEGDVQFTSEAGFQGTASLVYRVQNDAAQQVEAQLVVHTAVLAATGAELTAALVAALAMVALGVAFVALRRRREDGAA